MRGDSIDRLCRILCLAAARRRLCRSAREQPAVIQPKAPSRVNLALVAVPIPGCGQMPQPLLQDRGRHWRDLPPSIHRAESSSVHGSHPMHWLDRPDMKPDQSALALRGLTKRFDRLAVDALDLTVRTGEFYALLGPNGAGKTTTLRMVAGLLRPDAGSVSVLGIDALADPVAAKQITAWVSDEPMIYDKLTPLEYLEFVAGLWGIDPAVSEPSARDLLVSLGLEPHLHERCEGFSKGMRQKVALAGALVHDPRLIILDEPLTGLDAVSARHVKGLLGERVRAGCTVIMTTHILEVAERMADRIGVIASGRLIAEGTLSRTAPAERAQRHQPRGHVHRAGRYRGRRGMSSSADLTWFARHEIRLAWREGAGDADRRPQGAQAHRHHRVDRLCRDHAPAGLRRDRPLCRPAGAAGQIHPDRHHRDHPAGMGADAVAGDRIGDAGVLRPRRSRPDHVVAGGAGQRVFGAHRGDRAAGDCDGAVAVDAVRRCSRDRRRLALACRVRRGRRHWPDRGGGRDRGHGRAVSPDRPEPHPAGGANPRRRDRRRFCHCAAGRRDPVLRHVVAVRGADVGCRGGVRTRSRQPRLVAGARRARRRRSAAVSAGRRPRPARRRHGDLLAALCRHRRQRLGQPRDGPSRRRAQNRFAPARGSRRCAGRNSCC